MYEIYCKLRDERGVKDSDVVKGTGITKSTARFLERQPAKGAISGADFTAADGTEPAVVLLR